MRAAADAHHHTAGERPGMSRSLNAHVDHSPPAAEPGRDGDHYPALVGELWPIDGWHQIRRAAQVESPGACPHPRGE